MLVKASAEMGARIIDRVGELLNFHLDEAAVTAELGCCMDDIMLDYIPPSWPLVTQVFTIVNLFGGLYKVAESPVSADLISITLC